MKIMKIEYDLRNNSTLIQICDDSQTEYVYTPDGDKQSSIHRTASPNITVGLGENKKLAKDEILESDSTDYHGNLIVENGKPDKYLFTGGFASLRNDADGKPEIAFHYYDQDHLGNNRAVVSARTGAVEQITNYYPFGMPYTDQTAVNPDFQKYKYNGKELDKMHGLNTYDYGARQYYSIVPAWDRIDPMCEKYYDISPYAYCGDNPIRNVDQNGDSIQVSNEMIAVIYNGLENGHSVHMRFNNGILDPSSFRQQAMDTEDFFLKDLYEISINPIMVEVRSADKITYMNENGKIQTTTFGTNPYDYKDDFDQSYLAPGEDYGFHIQGNTGQSLFPVDGLQSGKRSTDNNIQIIVNSWGNLNQQTVGLVHEFAHVILFLRKQPFSHPYGDDFIYDRTKKISRRLGYDY